jgi:DNA polymerase-1
MKPVSTRSAHSSPAKAPRIFLIDTFGFIFRAYHARARMSAPPMRTASGLATEAVFIFSNMLRKLTREFQPEYLAAVFEGEGKTLREQEFAEYKANRAETPPELLAQIPYVVKLVEALRIPAVQAAGYEADDVIGTLSRLVSEAGFEVVIVSSDKDMLQLVNERVHMLNPAKDDTWYDPAKVKEFMGVDPGQVADLLALKGDPVDNIPGAPGIGEKGATELLAQFGSLAALLERAAEVSKRTHRESLLNNRERILMSQRLATIERAVPLEFDADAFRVREPDLLLLRPLLKELEFFSQLKDLGPTVDERPKDLGVLVDGDALRAWVEGVDGPLAVVHSAALAEVGLSCRDGEARSLPWARVGELRAVLEDPGLAKVACDLKSLTLDLMRAGIEPAGFVEDVSLQAFLLDADPGGCSLEALVERRLDLKPGPRADERALYVHDLDGRLRAEVAKLGPEVERLYHGVDLPLAGVLARMEQAGIRVDAGELARLSALLEADIARLTGEIHAAAGREFNIASPQQLGKVLFEELGLPSPRPAAKGKAVSTAADILDLLAPDYPIVRQVLEFRQLSKLKGTYVDALPALVDPATGRLHTSFNPTGAATGRLSSSNPNLQNIPVRTELGRQIRAAFVPREGWRLVVADYSQIELRLLAHMSQDPVLLDAFRSGEDIRTRTAAEVMGVPPMLVTRDARNNAKAVNFGIVYGISGFGLATNLGIPRKEAEAYNSRNANARGFAERTAVNSPIQGSAADLIKIAMVRIDRAIAGWQSKLLLQVHDELVFEAPADEVGALRELVKREMESACELSVPLVVETGEGPNWRDAK